MEKVKLTNRWVQSASLPAAGRREVADLLCPGLYLRVTVTGAKTWSLVMRVQTRVQRVTLGRYPVMGLADARRQALEVMREVANGVDPREQAAAERAAAEAAAKDRAATFGGVMDAYIAHISKNARSHKLIAANLRRPEMMPLHPLIATAVTKRELLAVIDAVAVETPQAAVNLMRHLKMALNYAAERDLLPANPLVGVRPPAKTTERERVLTDVELAAVWKACGDLPSPWDAMIRMLIPTGQRRCEVSNMRWEELDGDVWTIPRARVKSDRAHVLPLPPEVMRLLAPLRRLHATGFVFSTTSGRTAASNFAKIKAKLDELAGVGGRRSRSAI